MKAIICAGATGRVLIYGDVTAIPDPDTSVTITNARQIIRYDNPSVFNFAASGPATGDDCLISESVSGTTCIARQALSVSTAAATAIDAWPDAT